jgi:hypothetical protein
MSCREVGLLPARYMEVPDILEALDWRPLVTRDGGAGSQGGNAPSVSM